MFLVYDKCDKDLTIYDSYHVEKAVALIKSLALENFTEAYSLTNEKKYDVDNNTQKHLLFKQLSLGAVTAALLHLLQTI